MQVRLDCLAVGLELCRVGALGPGAHVGDDGAGGAEHDDAGAERHGAQDIRGHDRYPADGALRGPVALLADGDGVGEFVAFTDQRGQVLKVAGVGGAAEDDLHDGRVPDGACVVLAPFLPCLCQRLQHRQGGDPGAASLGHQRGK